MRIGMNPQKVERKITLTTHHRIVVVVYIPNEEGFYKNSFGVFKACIDSLISSVNDAAALTIVNNGCHEKVSCLLNSYLLEKKIDTLITHTSNIGKIDALIGAARGAREKYITISDADILFVKGWQENVEDIFLTFPNVGSVSPIPVRNAMFYATSEVMRQILLRRIKFSLSPIPENSASYNRYLESINWPGNTTPETKWPVVESKGLKAVIGSGHQVLTIDRDLLFSTVPTNPSLVLVGSNSEFLYVDTPIDKAGKLRLSTYNNFAFHMGNTLEPWMEDVLASNAKMLSQKAKKVAVSQNDLFNSTVDKKRYQLKKRIVKSLFGFFYGVKNIDDHDK
jgi:hypothetical protein